MFKLAIILLAIVLISAVFGFGGMAAITAEIAQFIFYAFISLLGMTVLFGAFDSKARLR